MNKKRFKQTNIFGYAVTNKTYFNHEATSLYEKVMEAFFYFHQDTLSKKDCGIKGDNLWNEMKNDQGRVSEYVSKHEEAVSQWTKKKQVFSPFVEPLPQQTEEHSTSIPTNSSPSPIIVIPDTACRDEEQNVRVLSQQELSLVQEFLETVEAGLSEKFLSDLVVNDKLVMVALHKFCKEYRLIKDQISTINTSRKRTRKTKLSEDLNKLGKLIDDLSLCIIDASKINVLPSLGLSRLRQSMEQKEKSLMKVTTNASKVTTFIKDEKLKEQLSRRVNQIRDKSRQGGNFTNSQLFCYNSDQLDWEEALSCFRENFGDLKNNCSVKCQKLLDLSFLLESSSIVSLDNVREFIGEDYSTSIIDIILKLLPLFYLKTEDKKEYLINIHQTTTSCDVIDQLLSPPSADNSQERNSNEFDKENSTKNVKRPSNKGGAPSIVSLFPSIPSVATEFIKINGFSAQEKRRDNNFQSCGVTVKQVREHLLEKVDGLKGYGISLTTVRYLFQPVHMRHLSVSRYKGYVTCKVPKKDNSARPETDSAHFIHSKVNMRLEHAASFNENYTVVSADAMNKVHVGTLAVSRYHQIRKRFHVDDKVKYNDHDFPLGYKLIPCGYLTISNGKADMASSVYTEEDYHFDQDGILTIESDVREVLDEIVHSVGREVDIGYDLEDDNEVVAVIQDVVDSVVNSSGQVVRQDKLGRHRIVFNRTGPLMVCIRNGVFHHLTMQAHANDMFGMAENAVANGKPFFLIIGDNGPDMDPDSYLNLFYWGRLWRDTNLTRLSCVTYPAGQSAYNPIEHCWSPLSNALTAVTLPAVAPGDERPPHKQTGLTKEEISEKERLMLDNAAEILSTYWKNLVYDGNTVLPIVIPSTNDGGSYDDHDDIECFLSAPLRSLYDSGDTSMCKLRKEFEFFASHTDRRGNEISLMKCQLFKDDVDVCDHCADNPPDNTAALRNESKLGGFLDDPQQSSVHKGHYKTYLDLKKEGCRYVPSASDLGRCEICPNWNFSSKTEKERHNRLLHRYPGTKYTSKSQARKPFICGFKGTDGKPCGRIFKTYHKLYKHKKEKNHAKNRKTEAKKKSAAEDRVKKTIEKQKIAMKNFFKGGVNTIAGLGNTSSKARSNSRKKSQRITVSSDSDSNASGSEIINQSTLDIETQAKGDDDNVPSSSKAVGKRKQLASQPNHKQKKKCVARNARKLLRSIVSEESTDDSDIDFGHNSADQTTKNDDPAEETELADLMKDRSYHHALESRQVKIMYEKWHFGEITWYNTKLEKYRVLFNDKSEDYINIDEIDGVDIILI